MDVRGEAYGQAFSLTPVDRFGVWLTSRQFRRWIPSFEGLSVLDAGCGYEARLARTFINEAKNVSLVDVALAPELKRIGNVRCFEGKLPESLEAVSDDSLDAVLCLSVLEHLWEPEKGIAHFHRILKPGGKCLLNVPNWAGKWFLEFSAFRLGLSPASEMDDHKMYYDPRELWPLLIRAGFAPSRVKVFRHKFGLNTFAVCEKGSVHGR